MAEIRLQQFADMCDSDIGGREGADMLGIVSVVALSREDSRNPAFPMVFRRGKNAWFIVDYDIAVRRDVRFDIGPVFFLVDISQDATLQQVQQP